MESNKNLWIGVGVIVVLALVIWMVVKGGDEVVAPVDGEVITEEEVVVEPKEDRTTGSVNASVPAASLSYQEALNKYSTSRIQLGEGCQATPSNSTYKDGATIMLDNRTASNRTIRLGTTFSLAAYSFKMVKLDSATVPATWLMDCDNMQNVATVLIQG